MPPPSKSEQTLIAEGFIHDLVQSLLQEEANLLVAGRHTDPDGVYKLRVRSARWKHHFNKGGFMYISILLRWDRQGESIHRHRVPYDYPTRLLRPWDSYPVVKVRLVESSRAGYALGARAGSGRPGGVSRSGPPRSRPEIGRARKRRRA